MTETNDNELTPEEKLLQVIRDGDIEEVAVSEPAVEPEPSAVVEDIPIATEASEELSVEEPPVTDEEPEVEEAEVAEYVEVAKPELKLVKKSEESKGDSDSKPSVPVIAPNVSDVADNDSAVVEKSGSGSLISIGLVNKILAIVVVAMIGFAIYEIWHNIKYATYKSANNENIQFGSLVDQAPEDKLPPLNVVLTKSTASKLIGAEDAAKADPKKKPSKQTTPVEDYVKKNLNLIGLSGDGSGNVEAIISDSKSGKMHFLVLGGTLRINDVDVKVAEITSEYIEFADGDKKIRIE